MFHQCQRLIQGIMSRSKGASKSEQIMVRNVISSLASMVQELSHAFKKAQSKYLKRKSFSNAYHTCSKPRRTFYNHLKDKSQICIYCAAHGGNRHCVIGAPTMTGTLNSK